MLWTPVRLERFKCEHNVEPLEDLQMKNVRRALLTLTLALGMAACGTSLTEPYTPDSGNYTPDSGNYTPDSGNYTPDSGNYTPDSGNATGSGG